MTKPSEENPKRKVIGEITVLMPNDKVKGKDINALTERLKGLKKQQNDLIKKIFKIKYSGNLNNLKNCSIKTLIGIEEALILKSKLR
jgi:hypothetical protein